MSSNDSGGLLVAVFGALVGYYFPAIIIGVISVGLLVFFVASVFDWLLSYRQEILAIWSSMDSKLASVYYRNRVRVLVFVGRIESK